MIINLYPFLISCLLIIVSIIIWCAVMPGYKAVSRAVLIIFGCLLGISEFVGMAALRIRSREIMSSGIMSSEIMSSGILDGFLNFSYMIGLVMVVLMAVYLFVVTWKTHSWKYKVPAGIVGVLNVAIGIVSKHADLPAGNYSYYQVVIRWLVPRYIGLIITLIVIWVMLIQFLQTDSQGKHSSSVIVCPACGARLEEQLNFCPKCGYRFK